ncbi:MAG TPA: molybdate ABC transporter substrate-binding protein [Anaerovoracaceae bacterium]|nr:molybdate ABC transporter substrate-binding protein [Anaerovoracaceae bacterium]
MKLFKKALVLMTVLALIFSMSAISTSAATPPTVSIDGSPIKIDSSLLGDPYIDSANRTQVHIRAISQSLGADIAWDQATQTATIDGTIKIKVGATAIETPYGPIAMDTSAVNLNGKIYVPAKYVAYALGYDIEGINDGGKITANIITKTDLTISAAASLTDALKEIQTLYKAEKPNATLAINFGGSGALQQQIEQGAPADVFFSAATSNMNALKDKGLMDDSTIKNLLKNTLVLVIPSDSKSTIRMFEEVKASTDVKKIALGDAATVPAGKYAQQVFKFYNELDEVLAKAVTAKDVREVLTWVETGNVDAGVVYSTDAYTSDKVKIVATAANGTHDPIVYPAGVVKATKHPAAARDFVNFLSSETAAKVFEKYGFSLAD